MHGNQTGLNTLSLSGRVFDDHKGALLRPAARTSGNLLCALEM